MSTEETTPTVTSTEQAAPTTPSSAPSTDASASMAPEAPAWAPDYTYEFDGKKREIDPLFRGIIKDEESQKKVRDYIQRAEALPKYRDKVQNYEKDWKPVVDQVSQLQKYFEKGDHDQVFKALGYNDEMIFKYVKAKLDQAQMPEDQRQLIEAKKMAELEKERFMEENNSYREQASQELARVTEIEMDIELAKPQYATLQAAYDKAYGSGSFKNLVIDRGAYVVTQQGQHVRPGQLLTMVAKEFAPFLSQNTDSVSEPQQPQQQVKKVIPNVGKGSGSPARQAITSIADLKKRAKQIGE